MAVPPKTDGRWQALLTGAIQPRFSLLATRLLVARLRQEVKQDSAALAPAIDELHTFFTSNEFVARDLAAL